MQTVNFRIYDGLGELIDEAMQKSGFISRAEFFRFLAVDFLRKEAQMAPPVELLGEYIRTVRATQKSRNRELPPDPVF